MAVLVTGVAGFIGMHVAEGLLGRGDAVIGIDNLNDYYSPRLKRERLAHLHSRFSSGFRFLELDFADAEQLQAGLRECGFDWIVHLGAQAGVRYSLENPAAYVRSNLVGHANMLEIARARSVMHLVYASSSSVYGANEKIPFSAEDRTDHPVSLYGATKKSDELLSESYAQLYRLPTSGLRFFTVYGPWGRPDMAPWLFAEAILEAKPIRLFNRGAMRRDFTYIDDVAEGVLACLDRPPADDGALKPGGSSAPHAIYNLGNNRPVELGYFLDLLETACGRPAMRELEPMQPGDVVETYADIDASSRELGFTPSTRIEEGVPRFVDWFRGWRKEQSTTG